MNTELAAQAQIYVPGRIFNREFIERAHTLLDRKAEAGQVMRRSKWKLKRMAFFGNLVGLTVLQNEEEQILAIGGITHVFRSGLLRRAHIAEFGSLAVENRFEGNGLAGKVITAMTRRYADDSVKALWRTGDFMVIGMVKTTNPDGNKTFLKTGGVLLDPQALPAVIFKEGKDYNTYEVTQVGACVTK